MASLDINTFLGPASLPGLPGLSHVPSAFSEQLQIPIPRGCWLRRRRHSGAVAQICSAGTGRVGLPQGSHQSTCLTKLHVAPQHNRCRVSTLFRPLLAAACTLLFITRSSLHLSFPLVISFVVPLCPYGAVILYHVLSPPRSMCYAAVKV
jgi:hypothetical protein